MIKRANILLTSGGTRVPIDRVRHIGNMSRGNFPQKIARAILEKSGDDLERLTFFKAAESYTPFSKRIDWAEVDDDKGDQELIQLLELRRMCRKHKYHYTQLTYKTYQDYESHFQRSYWPFDVVILAAAVSDYLVKNYVDGKIRSAEALCIELEPAPKIISMIKEKWPNAILIGFKLMVDSTDQQLMEAAHESCEKNGCQFVVANDLRDIVANNHRLLIVERGSIGFREYHADHTDPEYLAKVVAGLTWNTVRSVYQPTTVTHLGFKPGVGS